MGDVKQLPTVLTPWFVVYRQRPDGRLEYLRDISDGIAPSDWFSMVKGLARMYNNIRDAARVAEAEGAMIRVLVTREGALEFGHDG